MKINDIAERLEGIFEVDIKTKNYAHDNLRMKRMELDAGNVAYKHRHSYDHYSILVNGRAKVKTDESEVIYQSGDVILIKAGLNHEITAIDDIVWFCIHVGANIDDVMIGGD